MDFNKLDVIDKAFDHCTPMPIVSTVSGAGRVIYGYIELIVGIASAVINGIAQLFSDNKKYEERFDNACVHMFFGGANMVKGTLEAIPIINLLVFWYNAAGGALERKKWTELTSGR